MALFPESLDEIDFWDLDMFLEGDPHLAWSLLRREAPLWLHDRDGGEPFWCVTRYQDVHAVLADPLRFSSQRDGIWLRTHEVLQAPPGAYLPPVSVLVTDPPRHAPLRKVISHNFTPRAISRLEDQVRQFAGHCLDEVAEKQDVDFVTDVAHRIPAAIALSLMGVPQEDWDRLAELEHLITTGGYDPEYVPEGKDRLTGLMEGQPRAQRVLRGADRRAAEQPGRRPAQPTARRRGRR